MPLSPTQLRRSQVRDALIYWLYIPAAVILGGKTADLLLDLPPLLSLHHLPAILAAALMGIGVFLIQKATIDLKRYGDGTPNPQAPPARLVTEGSFSLCRHPMFLGYDVAALGTVLLLRSWGMLIIAYPVFIILQIRFLQKREEPVLARRFGTAYACYRKRVPFLLPNPFITQEIDMTSLLSLRRLWPSVQEHRHVEQEHLRLLHLFLAERYIAPSAKPPGLLRYAQKNFFSILFLAIYRAVGVTEDRRLLYGIVNHAIRGIVTATDNLLDDEYKELLPLRFAAEATRFKSVMHILLFDRILFHVLDQAAGSGLIAPPDRSRLQQALLDALVPIGEEEATEEKGVHAILPPEQILEQVHLHKGGNLLRLAFVAPRLIETELTDRLALADRGTFHIGMALQSIDDVTDFYDDLRDRRHNYLVSSIRFEGSVAEKTRLEAFLSGRCAPVPVEESYAGSVERVLGRAVQEALAGFDDLAEAGFWLSRQQALALIRYLFRLRGVGHLLPLLDHGLAEVSGETRQRAAQ